jgi:hypothetical protein
MEVTFLGLWQKLYTNSSVTGITELEGKIN